MRSLGGITVLSPADPGETRECLKWLVAHPCPSYLRLGKAGEAELHHQAGVDGGPICVRQSSGGVALVATGSILKIAIESAELAARAGYPIGVYSMPWIHPLDSQRLAVLNRFQHIFALEEHVSMGGMGSSLRENLPASTVVESVAYPLELLSRVGSQNYLRKLAGLTAEELVKKVVSLKNDSQTAPILNIV
jgi:transketolase